MAYTEIDDPSLYFETKIWTGNGTSQNITGLNFQPDFVWIKESTSTSSHALTDAVRGNTKYLMTNDPYLEETITDRVLSFNSDGYSLGSSTGVNQSGQGNVGWSWKANGTGVSNTNGSITSTVSADTTSGFSIVSYTGNGISGATVGHGLGAVPKMIIYKERSESRNWYVFTSVIDGSYDNLYLNLTDAKQDRTITLPTSSLFSLSSSNEHNASSQTYIAYCFAEKKGFSKFGTYTGNGSTNGTFVYTGFKPAFLIAKKTSTTSSWSIYDNKRTPYNVMNTRLLTNTNGANDVSSDNNIDFVSNGIKFRTSAGWNASASYFYMAFAENPFVTSTGIPACAR